MKKRIVSLLLLLLLCLSLALPVFADASEVYVYDEAGLLTAAERAELNERADGISRAKKCGVYIVTVPSVGGQSAFDFATDYYKRHDLGFGKNRDGVMLLISVGGGPGNRDVEVIGYGFGKRVMSEKNQDALLDAIYDDLIAEDYASACRGFLRESETLIAKTRRSVTVRLVVGILLALGLGCLLSLIPLAVMKGKLNNVAKQSSASGYASALGLELYEQRDDFLRTDVRRTRVVSDSSSGSRSGGGGTSHSSGGGFSGGGRKF